MLPDFITPMLAKAAAPFDSLDFLFEVKWDGTRALAFVEDGVVRLMNRRKINMTSRYPDLAHLGCLPTGTVVDGEIVVLKDGRADFNLLQAREQSQTELKIRTIAHSMPATFVAFDLLMTNFQSVMPLALVHRREMLKLALGASESPYLVFSEGVTGTGNDYFQRTLEQGLEGMMAKRLDSPYLPGKRTDTWLKIKAQLTMICAIIGYTPHDEDPHDFRNLILVGEIDGILTFVGKVGGGFNGEARARVNAAVRQKPPRKTPAVSCAEKAIWIEPGLYCHVGYFERTKSSGQLRAPVFKGFYPK